MMRVPALFLFVLWLALVPAHSQPFRVVTWKLEEFAPLVTNASLPDLEPKQLKQLVAALKPFEADVIVIEGLADRQVARRVAQQLRPGSYQVAQHHLFRKNGFNSPPVNLPVSILSKQAPLMTRAQEWRAPGIDAPGGMVFTAFRAGTNTVCLYTARLPESAQPLASALAKAQFQRRREMAAAYVGHHANWLAGALTNPAAVVLVATEIHFGVDLAPVGGALRAFEQGGFKRPSGLSSLSTMARGPAGSEELVPVASALMARHAEFSAEPLAGATKLFGRAPIAWDLVMHPAEAKASLPVSAPIAPMAASAPGAVPVVEPEGPARWVGWSVGLLLGVLSLVVLMQWLAWRTWVKALEPARRGRNAVLVDFHQEPGADGPDLLEEPPGALPEGATEAEVARWQSRALRAEQRARQAAALARSDFKPHMLSLLREKLVHWLTRQRSHLLDSQAAGTRQVIELEERLERIQAQFRERLNARERRISELQGELQSKERVVQELTHARDHAAGK